MELGYSALVDISLLYSSFLLSVVINDLDDFVIAFILYKTQTQTQTQ